MGFRWEEERYTDGVKWKFLEHKGPVFAPPYDPLPSNVKFYYDGKPAVSSQSVTDLTAEPCDNVLAGRTKLASFFEYFRKAHETQPRSRRGGHVLCQDAGP